MPRLTAVHQFMLSVLFHECFKLAPLNFARYCELCYKLCFAGSKLYALTLLRLTCPDFKQQSAGLCITEHWRMNLKFYL